MIPLLFHQIWLGDQSIHPSMQLWIDRWRVLHPGCTHKLWRDDGPIAIRCGAERLESRWPDLLQRACHLAQRSNIWRYELISRQGGVYLDTDMDPRTSIKGFLAEHDAFIASQWLVDHVSGACFGASPGHPWMADAVRSLDSRDPTIRLSMGDNFARELYLRHQHEIYRAPRETFVFYPHRNFAIQDRFVTTATLAIHRWSCFWYPTGYQALREASP